MRSFEEARRALDGLIALELESSPVHRFANELHGTLAKGKKVLVCGNGGSMADAMHFAEEFTGRYRRDRRPYPVIAISDPAHLSCSANDYGYEFVFSRVVEALGEEGDMLVALSTSGNSANVLRAMDVARRKRLFVVGLLGRGGGAALSRCDLAVVAPHDDPARAQELHMLILHAAIEAVEGALGH